MLIDVVRVNPKHPNGRPTLDDARVAVLPVARKSHLIDADRDGSDWITQEYDRDLQGGMSAKFVFNGVLFSGPWQSSPSSQFFARKRNATVRKIWVIESRIPDYIHY